MLNLRKNFIQLIIAIILNPFFAFSYEETKVEDSQSKIVVAFSDAYFITTEENEKAGRNNLKTPEKYFINLINSAQDTIDSAFYDIEDIDIAKVFINAYKRGVKVRIVTDSDNIVDENDPSKTREAITLMKDAGIPIVTDERSGLMHHKFMIIDDQKVWTGSMNLTTSSIFHHNNNSLIIDSKELAQIYKEEFNRLFEEKKFGPRKGTNSFKEVKIGEDEIRVYFSPKGGTREAIQNELKSAKKSILFMVFSLTDSQIKDIFIEKKRDGLKVEGIFDGCMTKNPHSAYKLFVKNNIESYKDGNQALLHHKVFIIDDEIVITGSFNFSVSAETSNNENTLIIKSKRIAKDYLEEYNRLLNAAKSHKYIPFYDHPACIGKKKK